MGSCTFSPYLAGDASNKAFEACLCSGFRRGCLIFGRSANDDHTATAAEGWKPIVKKVVQPPEIVRTCEARRIEDECRD
jgi:hypothetical protein